MPDVVVATFYRFVALEELDAMRKKIAERMRSAGVRGTVLLAPEGINATIAGQRRAIDEFLGWLTTDPRFADLPHRESITEAMPFRRIKVKLRDEIVTMGVAGIDAARQAGTYVQPGDWNALISDPDVTVVDTRNHYEVETGSFRNAVDPKTTSFREFPDYVEHHLDPRRHKKVAMFCTGGIRCEKASALLKQRGFEQVYHLYGGVLNYLAEVPREESLWDGECFVFDDRVTVDHNLDPGRYDQCHACRMPISDQDKQSADYVYGVSCPRCINSTTADQRAAFAERIKQERLAEQRGATHLGPNEDPARDDGR